MTTVILLLHSTIGLLFLLAFFPMGVIGRFFHGIENDTLIFGKGDATKKYINTYLPSNSNESYEYVRKPKTKSLEWS